MTGGRWAKEGILNFGSLNIDHVYRVDHIVRPGETLASDRYEIFAGGKGANQSAALALAGAQVAHAGRIGTDGCWLRDGLEQLGVDVSNIVVDADIPTGHAVIQVDAASGENAIFLYPGGNHEITSGQIQAVFSNMLNMPILLLQNEIRLVPDIIREVDKLNFPICLNPAPFSDDVNEWPLDLVDLLIVNETEAAGLAAAGDAESPEVLIDALRSRWPQTEILLTLGDHGAILAGPDQRLQVDAVSVGVPIDTTAAGDTFIGYFLAARIAEIPPEICLQRAATAAGIAVTRAGARSSIPRVDEVQMILGG